jgi:hypothetical protein
VLETDHSFFVYDECTNRPLLFRIIYAKLFRNLAVGAINKRECDTQNLLGFFGVIAVSPACNGYDLSIKFPYFANPLLQLPELPEAGLSGMIHVKNENNIFPFKIMEMNHLIRDIDKVEIGSWNGLFRLCTTSHKNRMKQNEHSKIFLHDRNLLSSAFPRIW